MGSNYQSVCSSSSTKSIDTPAKPRELKDSATNTPAPRREKHELHELIMFIMTTFLTIFVVVPVVLLVSDVPESVKWSMGFLFLPGAVVGYVTPLVMLVLGARAEHISFRKERECARRISRTEA